MSESARDLLVRGVAAGKAGEAKEARFFFEWVLRSEPSADQRTEACLWLSDLSEDAAEKRNWLEEVLANQPGEVRAQRKLALLNGGLRQDEVVDPDALPASLPPSGEAQVLHIDCPSCGAALLALAGLPRLGCAYCGEVIDVRSAGAELRVRSDSRHGRRGRRSRPAQTGEGNLVIELGQLRGHRPAQPVRNVTCRGCGAAFIVPPEHPSLRCTYCHAVHVVDEEDTSSQMAPDFLLPVQVDLDEALEQLGAWGSEQGFDTSQTVLEGFYLPFWTFEVAGAITAREVYVVPRQVASVVTREERLPLRVSLCVPATTRHPQLLSAVAQATPADSALPFDPLLLSGWLAEAYQIPLSQAAIVARGEAVDRVRIESSGWFRGRASYDTSGVFVEGFRLLLIPLWFGVLAAEVGGGPVCVHGITARVYAGET
jgi:DNA-directed RNA polymerase subunit RPC12/RpoP